MGSRAHRDPPDELGDDREASATTSDPMTTMGGERRTAVTKPMASPSKEREVAIGLAYRGEACD